VTLEACSLFICKRLNAAAIQNPNSVIVRGKPYPIMETDLGLNLGDPVLNNAAKILSILYIHDLRDLQTQINEAIVSVQNLTANPKTDTKLGKVGR
jgi:RLL motif-containing protein 1